MKRRRRICVALSATVVLSATGVALAATVTPPAGTPNMAAMVLQPGDLAAGAIAGRVGYVTPPTGFSAQYDGTFTTASTPDGISYYAIGDFVALAPSAATASAFVANEVKVFRSKAGHKLLDGVIIAAAGKKTHLKARDIKYQSLGSIGVGQGSFAEAIGVHVKHISVHEDVVLFGQNTAYAFLIMTARPGEKVPTSDATTLAGAIDSHITSVLGATGTTGTTGTTGAT